jgi:hypothetical protein
MSSPIPTALIPMISATTEKLFRWAVALIPKMWMVM